MKKSFLLITLFLALCFSIECYGKSLSDVEELARQGDAAAQCAMGDIYFDGEQVSQNKQEAFKWFKKSAEQNYTEAQIKLATIYYTGDGVNKNVKKAAEWFEKAAQQGSPVAQFIIASFYKEGIGVKKDISTSLQWLQKAADNGSADACLVMGEYYEKGRYLRHDLKKSQYYYKKAADLGNKKAKEIIKKEEKIKQEKLLKEKAHQQAINDNVPNTPLKDDSLKLKIYTKKDEIFIKGNTILCMDIICTVDNITIYDVIINRGNMKYSSFEKYPFSMKFGNKLHGTINGKDELLEVKILTDQGIGTFTTF